MLTIKVSIKFLQVSQKTLLNHLLIQSTTGHLALVQGHFASSSYIISIVLLDNIQPQPFEEKFGFAFYTHIYNLTKGFASNCGNDYSQAPGLR